MKALVTAFEPFGGEPLNASREAVVRLPARFAAIDIVPVVLPTSYARSHAVLAAAINRVRPDLVLGVGQSGTRAALCVERVAVNLQDADIDDNDGARPVDRPVVEGGPAAYLATLPVRAAVAALRAAALPAEASMSAGTFVCNHVFYGIMHLAAADHRRYLGGFLHVPRLSGQVVPGSNTPTMHLDDIVRGIGIVIEAATAVAHK